MRRPVLVLVLAFACLLTAAPASAGGPIRTGLFDPSAFASDNQGRAFQRSRAAGATMVRLSLYWSSVAPAAVPAGFNAADPANPLYNWSWFDRQVRAAVAHGLVPFVEIMRAPPWAAGAHAGSPGIVNPDPAAFGAFARAAAARYSGSFAGLPRIRYWQAWAEPNRDYFLYPQYEGGRIASAIRYREMVRSFAANVYAVNPTNVVVAGALAPVGRTGKPAPLAFMREMLCLSRSLRPTCGLRGNPVPMDVWAHHAYTGGSPTHRAGGPDNVSLGDLPKMRRYLRAAARFGHVRSHRRLGFWITEFSWDSSPPDPRAIPDSLRSRWIAEALFRMWQNGVSQATWWLVEDDPIHETPYQSGFFTVDGRAKRSLKAFRFPVVAFRRSGGVYVWGRTPTSRGGRIVVEVRAGRGWRRLGAARANGHGVFSRTFATRVRSGSVRARYRGEASLGFSLARVRDRTVNPFGCGGQIAC